MDPKITNIMEHRSAIESVSDIPVYRYIHVVTHDFSSENVWCNACDPILVWLVILHISYVHIILRTLTGLVEGLGSRYRYRIR